MAQFDVVDMNGKKVSTVELSDAVFGITPNEKAVHEAVVNFLANQRQGTQNTKIRKEVRGGGKKPWRQKGTGHARQGSIRAPQWTHGGVALGPKPRSYYFTINKKVNKAAKGHFDKADVAPKRTLREFRFDDIAALNVGDILKADVFAEGDKVDVVGTSKGKGYQGVIKRFGQHRLRESHGTGPVARHAGSNGSTSTPSRVFKGKRLPGHMGAVRVTVQNLSVVKVDAENNLIAIKGAIPGPKGSVVTIHDSVKA